MVNSGAQSERSTNLVTDLFSFTRSIRLTIPLFLVLAGLAIFGTLIPQNLPPAQYRGLYGDFAARLLQVLGITDLYHSWWFIGLIVVLCVNLVACSLHRFPATWRAIRAPQQPLTEGLSKTLPLRKTYEVVGEPQEVLDTVGEYLGRRRWTFQQKAIGEDTHLMAQKGRFGRFGVFVTHLGVMVILVGGLLTFLLGFKGHVEIQEGEAVSGAQDARRGVWEGFAFQVRCDKFQVVLYPDGTPKEYRSELSFLKDGKVMMRGPLRVNHPLFFEGFHFFQSSYGIVPTLTLEASEDAQGGSRQIRLEVGETFRLDETRDLSIRPLRYESNYQGEGPALLLAVLRSGSHPVGGWLKRGGIPLSILGWTIRLVAAEEHYWTGLQVKRDPGAIPVWIGGGLVLIGCIMAFFVIHRRIWFRVSRSQERVLCVLAASAPKGRQMLADKMEELCRILEKSGDVRLLEGELSDE